MSPFTRFEVGRCERVNGFRTRWPPAATPFLPLPYLNPLASQIRPALLAPLSNNPNQSLANSHLYWSGAIEVDPNHVSIPR